MMVLAQIRDWWQPQDDFWLFAGVLGWILAAILIWGRKVGPDVLSWRSAPFRRIVLAGAGWSLAFAFFPHAPWPTGPGEDPVRSLLTLWFAACGSVAGVEYLCFRARYRRLWPFLLVGLAALAGSFLMRYHSISWSLLGSAIIGASVVARIFWPHRSDTILEQHERRWLLLFGGILFLTGPLSLVIAVVATHWRMSLGADGISVILAAWAFVCWGALVVSVAFCGKWRPGPLSSLELGWPSTKVIATFFLFNLALLAAGVVFTNRNGERAGDIIRNNFRLRARTAAVVIDPESVRNALMNPQGTNIAAHDLLGRLLASLNEPVDDVEEVDLWTVREGIYSRLSGIHPKSGDQQSRIISEVRFASASERKTYLGATPFTLSKVTRTGQKVIEADAPILDSESSTPICWLALVFRLNKWTKAVDGARFQAIMIVGLFASLGAVFFVYLVRTSFEEELFQAKERAENAERAKSEFLAVMSHELRTPLQSVLGYTELALDTPLATGQRGYLESIQLQGRTLLRIVQDVLDFSALRQIDFSLQQRAVDLREEINDAVQTVVPQADEKDLSVICSIDENVPRYVLADAVRLNQILLNLLSNAVKFTDSGRVSLLASVADDAEVAGASVCVKVIDTGVGIDQVHYDRLFEPFFQIKDRHAGGTGAGLGLAITRRLVELMGGTIAVTSQRGLGTTFTVVVPFAVADGPAEDSGDTRRGRRGRLDAIDELPVMAWSYPFQVLIAEDNPFIQTLFTEYMRKLGYEPVTVSSGTAAVGAYREHQFELILMDLRMPGLDGFGAAREIRAVSKDSDHPWIIGLSASLREEDISKAMAAGMNDFLGKPVSLRGLLETILFSPLAVGSNPDTEFARAAVPIVEGEAKGEGITGSPRDPKLISMFVEEAPEILERMRESLKHRDFVAVREKAHYLANSCQVVCEEGLVELCNVVFEESDRGGNLQSIKGALDKLELAVVTYISGVARR